MRKTENTALTSLFYTSSYSLVEELTLASTVSPSPTETPKTAISCRSSCELYTGLWGGSFSNSLTRLLVTSTLILWEMSYSALLSQNSSRSLKQGMSLIFSSFYGTKNFRICTLGSALCLRNECRLSKLKATPSARILSCTRNSFLRPPEK